MNGVVQVKFLGRFGNQLHQYAACRKYAETIGAELEVPDWVGRDVFGLSDPAYSMELPERSDADGALEWGETNVRLCGYFQLQRWVGLLSRAELRRWFAVRPALLEACEVPSTAYTAAHLRRGDYVGNQYYANVPECSYSRACSEHGLAIDVWAREDSPRHVRGVPDFLPDFITLMRASILLRANSTFSWWAGALGTGCVYSPLVADRTGECDVDFVLGNWPRCMHAADDLHLPD